jgi:hypothetical protein
MNQLYFWEKFACGQKKENCRIGLGFFAKGLLIKKFLF